MWGFELQILKQFVYSVNNLGKNLMLYYLWLTGEGTNKSEKEQPVMGAKHKKWHL